MSTKRSSDSSKSCLFSYSDGRRCRMMRSSQHPSLCHYHARIEQQYLEAQRLGAEISTTLTGHFHTAADINHVLGRVFTALAQGRINRRSAATLIWACQLMLQSLPALKDETKFRYTYETWSDLIDRARPLSPPPSPSPGSARVSPPSAARATECGGAASAHPPAPHAPTNAAASAPPAVPPEFRSGRSLDRPASASAPRPPSPASPPPPTTRADECRGTASAHPPVPPSPTPTPRSAHLSAREIREKAQREAEFRRKFKPDSAFLKMFARTTADPVAPSPEPAAQPKAAKEKEEQEPELVSTS